MEERVIQFAPFLANRANEIAQLSNTVKSKFLNCTAQPFQVIHKHMRRRAMSHNRYRIPSQLRKKMGGFEERELQQRVPKCRKHLRKRKDYIFMRRSNKVLWMETHLYQVKRMKMIIYNGFKVAEKANEKNFRAVHRYFDHGSMIFDASFYYVVEGVVNGLVVDEHTIVHPQQLEDTEFVVHKNQFNLFQLIGKEALQSLNRLLQLFNLQVDGKTNKYFQFNYEYSKLQSIPTNKGRKIKTLDDYDQNMSNINDVAQNIGDEDLEKKIWQVDNENFMKRFKIDTRVRYTHQKVKKMLYQMNKKPQEQPPKEQVPVDLMKKKRAMRWLLKEMDKNENELSMEIEEQKPQVEEQKPQVEVQKPQIQEQQKMKQEQKVIPKTVQVRLLIIPPSEKPINSIDIGYKLLINMGAGLLIWRLFNQLKIKPIGLRDIRQLSLENNLQFYDYDDEDLGEKYLKSTNKLNYLALQFPYPFSFDYSMYQSWSSCQLFAYKNVPEKQALIFQPLDEDFELLKKGIYKIQVEKTEQEKPKITNRLELLQYEKTLAQIKLNRKILGIVQFGNISLQYGKGLGKGQIDSKFSKKELIVLFRNHNSEYYFFADCNVN